MSDKSDSSSSQSSDTSSSTDSSNGSSNSDSSTESHKSVSQVQTILIPRPSSGGIRLLAGLKYTHGNTTQAFHDGKYAGLQCTTMAATAIISNTLYTKWTPQRINDVIYQGDTLHTFLRDVAKLSLEPDGKIAVEDIPHDHYINLGNVFGERTRIKLKEACRYVFTSRPEGFEAFQTIKELIKEWKLLYWRTVGVLITLEEWSYAIMMKPNGKVNLFDSHGHLSLHGYMISQKAGILKLPSLDALEEFFIQMYGNRCQAVMAPLSVVFGPSEVKVRQKAKKQRAIEPVLSTYTPYLPVEVKSEPSVERKRSENAMKKINDDIDYGPSPFVGMMGGGD